MSFIFGKYGIEFRANFKEVLEILKTLIVLYTAILVITMVFIGGFVSLVTKEN